MVQEIGVTATPPAGFEVTVQEKPASLAAKLLPEIATTVPTRTFVLGVKVISGLTVKVAVVLSPRLPVTFTVYAPA
jgi:hypothetical protein